MTAGLTRRGVLTLGLTGPVLAGCGFPPVYMPTASGKPGVAARELSAIDVAIIPDRPGQLLRQALQERFGSDAGGPHRYRLGVQFYIAGEGVGIQPDNTITRIRLIGTANWTLTSREPARTVLTTGSARAMDGYNVFDQQYFAATLENEQVQKRISEAVADQVAMQLATWFRTRASAAG